MSAFTTNIEREVISNGFYRRVLFTGTKMQLVVMSLKRGEDIPKEIHERTEQFIRIESGAAVVIVNGKEHHLKDDDVIIIPAGTEHYVKNSGENDLKLYSIYAPPEHPVNTIHKTQDEADAAGR